MKTQLFIWLQYVLPQHLLSRVTGYLANSRQSWVKKTFIHWFAKRYRVDMSEAVEENLDAYPTFNDFFTRAIKPQLRPVTPGESVICSPADGVVSQAGNISKGRIFQAKGHDYSLSDLLGGSANTAEDFDEGKFAVIYLSPKDYHRVHMPATGTLRSMTYVPGKLFSVNEATTRHVPSLFARNERLVCIFDTAHGPMAVILVGAMIVAGIETVWAGQVAPASGQIRKTVYGQTGEEKPKLLKGDEMGRFKLGSTVVVLFGKDQMQWLNSVYSGCALKMGETIGNSTH